ncbi:putative mitochondrial protein, partial [Mucuna pruriens]
MVTEGIVLGHLVSNRGIEVDKAKIDIISSLPNPSSVREVRSFLGHAGFYRRFIKNFSKLALPLSRLLQKDVEFNFDQPCIEAFQELKNRLTSAPILQAPNWDLPFELILLSALLALQPPYLLLSKSETEIVHLCSVCLHSAETKPDCLCRDHLGSVSAESDSASTKETFKTTVKTIIITPPTPAKTQGCKVTSYCLLKLPEVTSKHLFNLLFLFDHPILEFCKEEHDRRKKTSRDSSLAEVIPDSAVTASDRDEFDFEFYWKGTNWKRKESDSTDKTLTSTRH